MQKVPLHQDGPIEISDTDLQKFLDLRKQSGHGYYFDYLYYDWLCERYPDGVRRLCLRYLLRTNPITPDRRAPNTFESLGRIFHVGGGDKKKDLYWTLYNRPKLLDELLEEFLYNILNNYYLPTDSQMPNDVAKLLLFLTTLTSDRTAWDLWTHHPLQGVPAQKLIKAPILFDNAFKIWSTQTNLPREIRDALWLSISGAVRATAEKIPRRLTHLNRNDPTQLNAYPCIFTILHFITDTSFRKTDPAPDTVITCLRLLEDVLPTDLTYLPVHSLAFLSYGRNIPDRDHRLALQIMRRHILKFDVTSALKDGFRFDSSDIADLYWLYGLVYLHAPDDLTLIHRLHDLLIQAHSEGNRR